jgi:hypothetical protein
MVLKEDFRERVRTEGYPRREGSSRGGWKGERDFK